MYPNLAPGAVGIRTNLVETIKLAAQDGWGGIDLPVDEALALTQTQSVNALADLFQAAGVRAGGWGLPLNWREPYDAAALATLGQQAALASQLGATRCYTWVMPASNERPFRENWEFHVRQLRPVAQVLGEYGVSLGLEFIGPRSLRVAHRYGFVYTSGGMLSLAQAIAPNVGLLLDCWHWYTSLGAPADILGLRAEDIVYVHVNDAPTGVAVEDQQDLVRRLPGETGVIEIDSFLSSLQTIGYDGPVTPEPFQKHLSELPAAEASRIVRASMAKVWNS